MPVCQLEKRGQSMPVGVMQPQILVHICKPGSANKGRKMEFFNYRAARQTAFLCPLRLNKI